MLFLFVAQTCNKWTFQGLCSFKNSARTPLALLSVVILKLIRLFQIDALTDWTAMSSLWSYTAAVAPCHERVKN